MAQNQQGNLNQGAQPRGDKDRGLIIFMTRRTKEPQGTKAGHSNTEHGKRLWGGAAYSEFGRSVSPLKEPEGIEEHHAHEELGGVAEGKVMTPQSPQLLSPPRAKRHQLTVEPEERE